MARKLIVALGLVLLVGGGFFWWRVTHPPLSDAEQIAANLEDIRTSLENNNIERALGYMAEDAKFQGQSRAQIRSQFNIGSFLTKANARVNLLNVRTDIKGASASTKGHYKVDVQQRFGPEANDGDFSLEWEKRDGNWVITEGSTNGSLPN